MHKNILSEKTQLTFQKDDKLKIKRVKRNGEMIMKLAIPVKSRSLDIPIFPSFGRTPLYALYDTETGNIEYLDNSAAESQGGAGIKAAQMLADHDANAVITYRCGENAAQVLSAAGILMYKAQDGTASGNIAKFRIGKSDLLSETHPGFHHHGGSKK